MNRDPKDNLFLTARTETVEMTKIDDIEQGAILRFTDVGRSGQPSEDREINTCYGDLYVIINALRDYASLMEGKIQEWGLTAYHAARYNLHADRCQKIAKKYAAAIGYDYDKAVERCKKRRAKDERSNDTGMDALEALLQKQEINPQKERN